MRITTRRKLRKICKIRKNKLTKRHKTLRVKRGGWNGWNGWNQDEKNKLRIIKLLANLILNNLNQEDTTNLCITINTNRTKDLSYQYDKLKNIHSKLTSATPKCSRNQKNGLTYNFNMNEQISLDILNALHHKIGVNCKTYFKDGEQHILLDSDFERGLTFAFSYDGITRGYINLLLYTMFAVCIEYLEKVAINGTVAYNFDDFDCHLLKTKISQFNSTGLIEIHKSAQQTQVEPEQRIVGDSPGDIQNTKVRLEMLNQEKQILEKKLVDESVSGSELVSIPDRINKIQETIDHLAEYGNNSANQIINARRAIHAG